MAIRTVAANSAYFDAKATRWEAVPALYAADLRDVKTATNTALLQPGPTSRTTRMHS